MSDQDLVAKFLAERSATQCGDGVAYGVDKDADKAKRAEARTQQQRYVETECDHDARMEAAHDAFFTGDKVEGYRLLGERRYSVDGSAEAVVRSDGRAVRLNRY